MKSMWHKDSPELGNVKLVPLSQEHLETLLEWRNNPDISKFMLNQNTISPNEHKDWFEAIREDKGRACFVSYYKDEAIGSANLKSSESFLQNASSAESGFYMAPGKYRGTIVAFLPALLLHEYAFNSLNINKLTAYVKPENSPALRFNEALGYTQVQDVNDNSLVYMELKPEQHQAAYAKLHRFALR